MTTTIKIRVTAEHIRRGARSQPFSCPIALACQAAGQTKPLVGLDVLFADDHKHLLPPAVQQWVRNFDDGLPVEPFEFELGLSERP